MRCICHSEDAALCVGYVGCRCIRLDFGRFVHLCFSSHKSCALCMFSFCVVSSLKCGEYKI